MTRVWVTRWALVDAILVLDLDEEPRIDDGGGLMLTEDISEYVEGYGKMDGARELYIAKGDFHLTEAEAIADVEARRKTRMRQLHTSFKRIESKRVRFKPWAERRWWT